MINLKTLLSSFNEKGTLLKWLVKVEDALQKGAMKDFTAVDGPMPNTIVFRAVFADDTFIESDPVTVPQGAQGPEGATGPRGEQGVGVKDVEVTPGSSSDEGITYNVTVHLTDGQAISAGDFLSPIGKTGEKGDTGTPGAVVPFKYIKFEHISNDAGLTTWTLNIPAAYNTLHVKGTIYIDNAGPYSPLTVVKNVLIDLDKEPPTTTSNYNIFSGQVKNKINPQKDEESQEVIGSTFFQTPAMVDITVKKSDFDFTGGDKKLRILGRGADDVYYSGALIIYASIEEE